MVNYVLQSWYQYAKFTKTRSNDAANTPCLFLLFCDVYFAEILNNLNSQSYTPTKQLKQNMGKIHQQVAKAVYPLTPQ